MRIETLQASRLTIVSVPPNQTEPNEAPEFVCTMESHRHYGYCELHNNRSLSD
jgi:hypothetical protein